MQRDVCARLLLPDLASPVNAFLRDCCVRGREHVVPVDALWAAWRVWAKDNGHPESTAQVLGKKLRALIPGLSVIRPRVEGDRPRLYTRVALRDDEPR
jgi:putative DNA primase/helicase